jgi:hypothetical protein
VRGEVDGKYAITRIKIKVVHRDWGFEETFDSVPQMLQGWSVSADIGSQEMLKEPLPPITPIQSEILANLS